MRIKFVFIICILFVVCVDNYFVVAGRGRSRGSHSRHKPSTHSGSSGGHFWSGWFNWGSGSSSSSSTNHGSSSGGSMSKKSPAPIHRHSGTHPPSHAGFAKYGKDYEANFHNIHLQRQYTPVPHPYQSHFHPQTTDVFAYHFMPQTHIHHHVHHHYMMDSRSEPIYYDYNSSMSSTPISTKQPIIYDYKPPSPSLDTSSSDEIELSMQTVHHNDILIAGVENMLLYGNLKDNQHQILFVQQASDGISLENELLMAFNNFGTTEAPQYFPDVEFRFDADDEPNDDDLQRIYRMYKDLVDDGRC